MELSIGRGRADWVDRVRGLAVLALVSYHAVYGLVASGHLTPDAYRGWGPTGELVRMPLMMLVAGTFVEPSLRKGTAAYLSGKARRILWPFLLWSAVYVLLRAAVPGVNNPASLGDLLLVPLDPGSHTWFLRTLLAYYLLALLLPLPWLTAAAVVAALAGGGLGHALDSGLHLLVFLCAGMWLRRSLPLRVPSVLAVAVVPAGLLLPLLTGAGIKYTPAAVPVALLGCAAAVVLAASAGGTVGRLLSGAGRRSLELYLAHVLFASGARVVLSRAGVEDPAVLLAACLSAGVVGPLLLARLNVPFMFEWPRMMGPFRRGIAP